MHFSSDKCHYFNDIMDQKKNVFVRSAELGVPFGIMLTVASMSMIYGDKAPLVSLLAMIVAIVAPVVLYLFQRQYYVRSNGFAPYSELWTLGIFTTIGGALICGLISYGVIIYFRPDFLYEQAQMIVDTYKHMPQAQAREFVSTFDKMIKNDMLPNPFDYCVQMFWLTSSLGCVGGAVTAFIASKTKIKDGVDKNQTKVQDLS